MAVRRSPVIAVCLVVATLVSMPMTFVGPQDAPIFFRAASSIASFSPAARGSVDVLLPSSDMASRIVLCTGANQGIGYEIARAIGKIANFRVLIGCRNEERGREAATALQKEGCNAEYVACDISEPTTVSSMVASIDEQYGKLDVLINNAAMAFKGADPTPFAQQARPTVFVNYHGTLDVIRKCEPLLRKGDAPRCVTVASEAGHLRILKSADKRDLFLRSETDMSVDELTTEMEAFVADVEARGEENGFANTCYGMSKLGVIALTKILARQERANGSIKYDCFCPGYCATSMSSMKGPRPASKGAETGVFLATSSEAVDLANSGKFYKDLQELEW